MKLIKMILLLSLASTVCSKNQLIDDIWPNDIYTVLKSFQKIEQLWNYFTPEAQKKLKILFQQKENKDFKNISSETDLKLLYLILSEDELAQHFSPEQTNTMNEFSNIGTKLKNRGLTETEACLTLFSSILTHDGCDFLASNDELYSDTLLKPLRDALVIHQKLNVLIL